VRLTFEKHPTRNLNCSGQRRCDVCSKEEFLKKPSRWDICLCCERKDGIASGRRKQSIQVKTKSYINYCEHCSRVFEIRTKHYSNQKFCSSKCMGASWQIYDCLDCGIKTAGERCDQCRERLWHRTTGRRIRKERYDNDLSFKLKISLRSRIKSALKTQLSRVLKKYSSVGHIEAMLGCTLDELKQHLESKFKEGMTWENWSHKGWHVDHIYPLSKIDLTDPEQLKKACHYTNLQPLWARENLSKHDKIPEGVTI